MVLFHAETSRYHNAQKQRRNLHNTTEAKPKLTFPKNYHVKGTLKLPYGDIVEPFEAWYSREEKMSRIDYYGGNVLISSWEFFYFKLFSCVCEMYMSFLNFLENIQRSS